MTYGSNKDEGIKSNIHVIISKEGHKKVYFSSDPGIPGVRSMGPGVSTTPCRDLTDVTLPDEDTNSILADNDN